MHVENQIRFRPRAIVAALVVAAAFAPQPASAGVYTAIQCSAAFGVGAPDALAFDHTAGNRYVEVDNCANESSGGGLSSSHPPTGGATQGGTAGGWYFLAPPHTRFVAIEALASGSRGAGEDYVPELLALPPLTAPIIGNGSVFATPIGPEATQRWEPGQPGDGSGFTIQMRCARISSAPNCETGEGNFVNVRQISLAIFDSSPPALTNAGSSLASPTSVRGVVAASVAANDAGAGIRSITASVNGAGGGEAKAACSLTNGRAMRLVPCPGSLSAQIAMDTTQPPWHQGLNRTSFCAVEYADTSAARSCAAGPEVRVDNECPLGGMREIVGFEQLRFEGGKAGDGRTTYGAKVELTGRAVDADDEPVARAELCVAERVDLGPYTEEKVVRTPRTGERGRFSATLPSGPGRVFRVAHWQQGGGVVEQFASLAVKAKPRLAVRPKGRIHEGKKVRLRVNLNRPVAPGQPVQIQARSPSGFVALPNCIGTADVDGRLTCTDRLPNQPGKAAYTVSYRAVVPRVEGSAWLDGMSKIVTKRVTG